MSDETKPPDDPRPAEPSWEYSPEPPSEPPPEQPAPQPDWAATERVTGPAVGLIVVAAVGAILNLSAIPLNLIGVTLVPWAAPGEWWADVLGGLASLLCLLIGLAVAAVVFFAGIQMKNLRNWTLAAVASVLVMIPCVSPCCLLGIPVGIWSLIVLSDPSVRASFR